jgi:hypothetical protein
VRAVTSLIAAAAGDVFGHRWQRLFIVALTTVANSVTIPLRGHLPKGIVVSPVESLDKLIAEHGWATVLTALVQIADADELPTLTDALMSVLNLVADQGIAD